MKTAPSCLLDSFLLIEDRFLGEKYLGTASFGMGHNASTVQPNQFNMLGLVLMACVVNQERLLYSILGDQCFWFANIMLTAIQLLFEPSSINRNESRRQEGAVFMPFSYLPGGKVSGRFRGVKVSAIEDLVLAHVCAAFLKRYNEEITTVS